jgi:hypothetical protein
MKNGKWAALDNCLGLGSKGQKWQRLMPLFVATTWADGRHQWRSKWHGQSATGWVPRSSQVEKPKSKWIHWPAPSERRQAGDRVNDAQRQVVPEVMGAERDLPEPQGFFRWDNNGAIGLYLFGVSRRLGDSSVVSPGLLDKSGGQNHTSGSSFGSATKE